MKKMADVKKRWHNVTHSLFVQVSALVLFGILTCVIITLSVTMRASERLYLDAIKQNANQSLQAVDEKIQSRHNEYVKVLNELRNHWATKNFLQLTDPSSKEAAGVMYHFNVLLQKLGLTDNSDSLGVMVTDREGRVRYTNAYSGIDSQTNPLAAEYTLLADSQPKKIHYFFDSGRFLTRGQEEKSCMLALSAVLNKTDTAPIGYVCLVIRESAMRELYAPLSNNVTTLLLLDGGGKVVSAGRPELMGAQSIERRGQAGQADTVLTKPVAVWGAYVAALINTAELSSTVLAHAMDTIWLSGLITLFTSVMLFLSIEHRFKPLRRLVAHMSSVTTSSPCTPIELRGGPEVMRLAGAYNMMVNQVNAHTTQLVESERQKRELELKSMRMQINPHFIYNTLTSIKFLVWQRQTEKAAQSIDTLTKLLQSAISSDEEMIVVAEELKNLESYSFLQKMRFGDRIAVDFHVEPGAMEYRVPKMILQPFLENAFFHAFPDQARSGNICVFISARGDFLSVEIIDNGRGIREKGAESRLGGTGIGIANVNQRIQLMFGSPYGVVVSSQKEAGTMVSIKLPLIGPERALGADEN